MRPVWLSMHSVFSLDRKMNDVVGINDIDRFMIEKKFYCKELGVLKVSEEEASSFIFDMGIRWRDLTPKQQRQCMFLTRNIHKLPFGVPRGAKAFYIDSLGTIVKKFYDRVKLNTLSSIAYICLTNCRYPQQIWKAMAVRKLICFSTDWSGWKPVGIILANIPTNTVQKWRSKPLVNG